MDHRTLLRKYMALVDEHEGVTFVDSAEPPEFTAEEVAELRAIEAETPAGGSSVDEATRRAVDAQVPSRQDDVEEFARKLR